jgi:enamine deaminase RidA (YjgF/YER057c/UK114 family)
MKQAIEPAGHKTHPSLSSGVLATGTNQLYVSGMLPTAPDGSLVGAGDVTQQLDRIWERIQEVVETAGATLADIVRVTAWITAHEYAPAVLAKRIAIFDGKIPPASAMVVVAGLVVPGAFVEVDAFVVF